MVAAILRRLVYDMDLMKLENYPKLSSGQHGFSFSVYHVFFVGFLVVVNGVKWGMFGRLTRNEIRSLKHRIIYTIWEFTFGLLLFYYNTTRTSADIKHELFRYSGLFLCVLLLKCFHFLSADRVNNVFDNSRGSWAQHRFGVGLLVVGMIDVLLMTRFYKEANNYWMMRKSSFDDNILVAIFGFEIINMFPLIVLTGVKYGCSVYHQKRPASVHNVDQVVHVCEFLVNLTRFLMVCVFSAVFLYFYAFPYHIMPSSYMSLRVLVTKTRDLIRLHKKNSRLARLDKGPQDGDCAICFDNLSREESRITKCNHSFHFQCLQEWANYAESCPVCRCWL